MDKIKRMILLAVPLSICNLRCDYCYLTHREEAYQNVQPKMRYSPEHIAKALSAERLGGPSYINFCANGETLLLKNIESYVSALAKEGHYIEIVTNNTVTAVLDKILALDKELLEHISFKCSFHYLELKKRGLLDTFAANVKKIWAAGASANIEVTPSDELIPLIDEMKEFSMLHFGALPHITIARDDRTKEIDYLTNLSLEEYDKAWSSFDSDFFKFKRSIFKIKRNEFCYAGAWLLFVNAATGDASQCYKGRYPQNIFEDTKKPIHFVPVGKCLEPHCYNGHMLLTLGCIPHFTQVKYGDIRDRVKTDGTHWIRPQLRAFFNSALIESNKELTGLQKLQGEGKIFLGRLKRRLKKRSTEK